MSQASFSYSKTAVYQMIYSSALKLLHQLPEKKIHEIIVNETLALTKAKYASIFLASNGEMQRIYTSSPHLFEIIPRKRGVTWSVYTTNHSSLRKIKRLIASHPELEKFHIGSDISVPLFYNNKTIGVLSALSHEDTQFTKQDLINLQLFSPLATAALINTKLHNDLENTLKERDLFISIAAHELKTPLTALTAYLQLLFHEKTITEKRKLQYNDKIMQVIKRLTLLINDLLQASNMKASNMRYLMKKCNIKTVLQKVVTDFHYIHNRRIVHYREAKDIPHIIYGDKDKLYQAISNLLTNAAKFSQENAPIIITLTHKKNALAIEIKDHGIGIAKQHLPHIFDRFYKASTDRREGLGLGLYLVKNIIDHHHGTVKVTSRPNKGTVFTVSLPVYGSS